MDSESNSNNTDNNKVGRGGPKTARGKSWSRLNARKEGLFSRELLVTEADRPLYDKICADLRRQLRRDTTPKQIAVENIITCTWPASWRCG